MKFEKTYLKYMAEANTANEKEVGKRVSQEMMSYIDNRKEHMNGVDYTKTKKLVDKIVKELNPDTIFDDMTKIGIIIGSKNSYKKLVAKVLSIINELEDPDNLIPKEEPKAKPEEDDSE